MRAVYTWHEGGLHGMRAVYTGDEGGLYKTDTTN